MPLSSERDWHTERHYDMYSRDMRMKEERVSEQEVSESEEQSDLSIKECNEEIQKTTLMVKQEEKILMPMEKQYPLAGLENSYPIIDYMIWHNWLMQRQKTIEFQMKTN